ncbi:MAG: efflux RND transporter periplasmic adaptor subunit [Chitinophagaceae bacterium]|nr:efflux RND transporter periplasmic adaptor subunit [Chitinophagaceae bacterium]
MKKILNGTLAISFLLLLAACGGTAAKDQKGELGDLKVKLEKKKKEKNTLDAEVRELEEKIAKADPSSAQAQKLVAVDTLRTSDFVHFIELQGKVDADNVAYVAPSGAPGIVRAIYVKEGSRVGKGQTILKLDDALQRQGVIAAQQNAGVLKARLAQAQTIYERYQNLWKQNIGTEMNVINAKAEVDALQSQLRAAQSQVSAAQEQLNYTTVRAQISGIVDQLNVKVGEIFSGAGGNGMPQILIVNNNSLKVVSDVPENYISRVKKGDSVEVVISETGRPYRSVINLVGASIDPTKRSFIAEAKLASDPLLKPNQLAKMKILDYKARGVVTVPVNVIQTDEKGKYVFVIEKAGEKVVVRKKIVNVGETYNGVSEIKGGLNGGDVIVSEGYQTVYDGQSVLISK